MSVEGVPSVDDVAAVVQAHAGLVVPDDAADVAEAVHALYAPHLEILARNLEVTMAENRRYREALETVRNVGDRAAVQVADAALAEPKEQD